MIQICDASPPLISHLATKPSLENAVDLVIGGDEAACGRDLFNLRKTQFVQIRSPSDNGPDFCCIFPLGREDRPFNANDAGESPDPLSLEAVRQTQQNYFLVSVAGFDLLLLANPYPYAPRCVTWVVLEMPDQSEAGSAAAPWSTILKLMLLICGSLGGDMVGFNGVANSQRRMHFVSHRQPAGIGPYALQQAARRMDSAERRSTGRIGRDSGYPLDAWRFGFPRQDESADAAARLLDRWAEAGGTHATATVAAALEDDVPVLYVVPRNRLLSPFGWPSPPAVMEVLGAGVSSRPDFIERVRGGDWGYENFRRFLSSLSPRGIERLY